MGVDSLQYPAAVAIKEIKHGWRGIGFTRQEVDLRTIWRGVDVSAGSRVCFDLRNQFFILNGLGRSDTQATGTRQLQRLGLGIWLVAIPHSVDESRCDSEYGE